MKLALLCEDFDSQFRNQQLSWGERNREFIKIRTEETKKELLRLAVNGARRPKPTSSDAKERRLANSLGSYTGKSRSYDREFDDKIRALAPQWFLHVNEHKEELLTLAKSGAARPSFAKNRSRKERILAGRLNNYIQPTNKSYDAEFVEKLRKIAPGWLVDKVAENRKRILEIAKSGGKRPWITSTDLEEKRIALALNNYLKKSHPSYDSRFVEELQKIRPDWFPQSVVAENKRRLLAIAKSSGARPKFTDDKQLARAIMTYTDRNGPSYDEAFDAEIRRLRPDWFGRGYHPRRGV
jgi:hypothetical protein